MLGSLFYRLFGTTLFGPVLSATNSERPRNELTREDVERAIDEAGRAEVFARAALLGWSAGGAPLWVWSTIAQDIKYEKLEAEARRNSLH